MESAGGPAAGNRAAAIAVFQCATQAAADGACRPTGADHHAVTFEPDFASRIAREVLPVSPRQHGPQVQRRDSLVDVEMDHHGGALAVRTPLRLDIPAGFNQPQEGIDRCRHWWVFVPGVVAVLPVAFPLGHQSVTMRLQRGL